ncbi:hypothetical protein RSAG8_06921, partial [Rhizoctonia solani AG-8 WAC10335]
MFSALSSGAADGPPPPIERTTSGRKPSVDLGPGGSSATAGTGGRRKLVLQPRIKPSEVEDSEPEGQEVASVAMTEEEAQNKAKEDVKEYLAVENIDEAIMALEYRHLFVDKLVNTSMDGGNKVVVLAEKLFFVVVLAEKLFFAARTRSVIFPEGFERGLLPTIEMADDLSIDVPKTYEWLARMIHAAGLGEAKTEEMADKISVYGGPPVPPREPLMKEFERLSYTPSPSLGVTAQPFAPGNLRRKVNAIRISTPSGDLITFGSQTLALSKGRTLIPPKRQAVVVHMETKQQKEDRLTKEQEAKEREANEKAEKEFGERIES